MLTTQFGSKKKITTQDEVGITNTNDYYDVNSNTLHTFIKKPIEIERCESSLCDTVEANVHAMLRIFTMIPETIGIDNSTITNVNCILNGFTFDSTLSNYLGYIDVIEEDGEEQEKRENSRSRPSSALNSPTKKKQKMKSDNNHMSLDSDKSIIVDNTNDEPVLVSKIIYY